MFLSLKTFLEIGLGGRFRTNHLDIGRQVAGSETAAGK
jgi:hypothetical protein